MAVVVVPVQKWVGLLGRKGDLLLAAAGVGVGF